MISKLLLLLLFTFIGIVTWAQSNRGEIHKFAFTDKYNNVLHVESRLPTPVDEAFIVKYVDSKTFVSDIDTAVKTYTLWIYGVAATGKNTYDVKVSIDCVYKRMQTTPEDSAVNFPSKRRKRALCGTGTNVYTLHVKKVAGMYILDKVRYKTSEI